MERPLADKVAIVTGASSGIGAGIAKAMAAAGATILLVGRDANRLRAVEDEIARAGGVAESVVQNLATAEAPAAVVGAVIASFGRLDVLVHAAGIFLPEPFEDTSVEHLDLQWDVNVRAPFLLTQAALPALDGHGVVIFLSSIAGHVGFLNSAAYCATKGAVELLTRSLAAELAHRGVRINAIAPGNVLTPMNAHLLADKTYEQRMLAATPVGRVGQVEDIAPVAVFLASDAARYIHGESLLVDGGWVAQ